MAKKHLALWTRTPPIMPRDNIISSDFVNMPKFKASYENETTIDMYRLLAHDYGKTWLFDKQKQTKVILETRDNDFLMRRYVIRGLLAKKKIMEQKKRFILKRFRNIPPRICLVGNVSPGSTKDSDSKSCIKSPITSISTDQSLLSKSSKDSESIEIDISKSTDDAISSSILSGKECFSPVDSSVSSNEKNKESSHESDESEVKPVKFICKAVKE